MKQEIIDMDVRISATEEADEALADQFREAEATVARDITFFQNGFQKAPSGLMYRKSREIKSWSEAKQDCENYGTTLANALTKEEFDEVSGSGLQV